MKSMGKKYIAYLPLTLLESNEISILISFKIFNAYYVVVVKIVVVMLLLKLITSYNCLYFLTCRYIIVFNQ